MELKVKDMSCGGCANSIARAVIGVDPAAKLDIDVTTKTVKIHSALPPERLVAVIEAAGFHPTVNA
ncbi:heavy metal-associated domain-containing protein [Paraburkholderia strydomiana]|jgi:copper chaperone|uniref:heavy-metal-associated domain-containing protein n=1 Tax=Paraburkholderia strydomiana TaxID=1245417 RepID=UPI0038BADFD6